jgi:hypothetical protein
MFRISTILFAAVFAQQTTPQSNVPADPIEMQRRADAEAEKRAVIIDAQQKQRVSNEQLDIENKMREFLSSSGDKVRQVREAEVKRREVLREDMLRRFRESLRGFQVGRQQLDEAIGFRKKLKDPGKKIQQNLAIFLTYLKQRNREHPRFDSAEFKGISQSDLAWQTLTVAETVEVALAAVIVMETRDTVDIRMLASLPALEKDLLRLQWMAGQLK